MKRSRYRRGTKSENIHFLSHLLQVFFVGNAESLLLVDYQQTEFLELDILLDYPVSTDTDIDLPRCQVFDDSLLFCMSTESTQHLYRHRECV